MESHLIVLEFFLSSAQSVHEPLDKDPKYDSFPFPGWPLPFLGKGIAVQFLDYPVIYLPTKEHSGSLRNKGDSPCGKRCILDANLNELRLLIQEVML